MINMPITREVLKEKNETILNTVLNKGAVGWDIKLNVYVTDATNPLKPTTIIKSYNMVALISKNNDAYAKTDITNNIEFKVCKIFVSDIEALNESGANIPVPPASLKKANATISIDNGTPFQIKSESFEGFNRRLLVLDIQREA